MSRTRAQRRRARRRRARRATRLLMLPLPLTLGLPLGPATSFATTSREVTSPALAPGDLDWLEAVNHYRAIAHLDPVTEDPSMTGGQVDHACYMLQNGMTHAEVVGQPGYTPAGAHAGPVSNVAVSTDIGITERTQVEQWMRAPFHALGILRPGLRTVSFGACRSSTTTPWHAAAALDIIDGLGPAPDGAQPVLFPGDGTTTTLTSFGVETPDPVGMCGWSGAAGLPLVALLPRAYTGSPTASLVVDGAALEVCVLSTANTSGIAATLLGGDHAVVVVPRRPLRDGVYHATLDTSVGSIAWTFGVNVDPSSAVAAPADAHPIASGLTLSPVTPTRLADSRLGAGLHRVAAGTSQRIQVTGEVVPPGAVAVSANVTVTDASGPGYVTLWDCATDRPNVSSVNVGAGDTVPNGVSAVLDGAGGVCVHASVDADVILDVNGFYAGPTAASASGRFAPVTPSRVMDTRESLGGPSRLHAGDVARLRVTDVAGVPAAAEVVMLNVTAVAPASAGYITVHPCERPRPLASSLNPQPGRDRPNLVVTPVGPSGEVCLYTSADVDVVVDVTGYVASSLVTTFTATAPFRFIDTRDAQGSRLVPGRPTVVHIAGQRSVPADATAVVANVTAVGADDPGYITAYPCGSVPPTSTVNVVRTEAAANGTQIALSPDGQLCLVASTAVDVIVDISGWWS